MKTERHKLISKFMPPTSELREDVREHVFNSLIYSVANIAHQHEVSIHAVLREYQHVLPRLLGNHKAGGRAQVIKLIEEKLLELQSERPKRKPNYDSEC